MPEKKLWLLFFGRLDDEKWFGLILDMLHKFIKQDWEIPFSLYVFGKWKYVQDLLDIAEKYNSIHFFGRQSLETIQRYQENCQFCLMPSTFLETFWLTALSSLNMWIPVVWFTKWWLKQFVSNKYDISKEKWLNDSEKLYNKIKSILEDYREDKIDINAESKKAKNIAKKFSKEKWFDNIKELIWKPKKILLVTDFKSKLWGIETYVYDVAKILTTKWYDVKIYWVKVPTWRVWQFLRYFGLFFALWNFVDAIKLRILARKFKPKVIRYHSTLRRIGRWPIKSLSKHRSKKLMMYHDLWYFHPFPSKVLQEDMIYTPMTLINFLKTKNKKICKNPIKFIAICFKYISIILLKKQLKKSIDHHLVPSKFMEDMLIKSYNLKSKKVQTLSHFIQE